MTSKPRWFIKRVSKQSISLQHMKEDHTEHGEQSNEMVIRTDPGQSPIRIDKFLLDRLEKVSRNKIQNGIKEGAVTINGKAVKANYKVRPNEDIHLALPPSRGLGDRVIPEEMDLDIRYEDKDLMVIFKPPGLVVHPGIGNETGTLVNGLAHYFKNMDLPVKEGNELDRPGIVHRIDKNTSGLMLIAKTEFAMTELAKQFFDHSIDREYIALIWGAFDDDKGTIEGNIGRHPKERLQMTVFPDGDEGKHAVTHYEVLKDMYYVSLVKCKLETGRTHQIRVHMKYKGHPLFNDERYGGQFIKKGTVYAKYKQFVNNCFKLLPRQALHAKSIGFVHPSTKEYMHFTAELPSDFQEVVNKWHDYVSSKKAKM